ncbi:MAG: antibiotic biosynthesis monooxygenase [Tannerellaceae bacterium]|jgi:quinol monooxygenase YgiN|nr:antibiotic biosynthesis monooxygenase [Tannerellaceae bacterium]
MKKGVKISALLGAFCSVLFLCSCNSATKEKETAKEAVSSGALTIVANVTLYPESEGEVLAAIEAVVAGTRKEEGNISYDVFRDVTNPLRYTFIENWKSQEAIASHNASAHFIEFAKAIENKADLEAFTMKQKY